ncbi:glycoside hydrolase family 15 protein [Candidatus Saccharibacteria bacterium]|nr:glycoside hydrolase family 15 protein [Candidatus Saccharibacteria bacterium]
MARTVILGNSELTVGLDENGLVHDFYYPYVGLENLTTARIKPHHIGVWVDGKFSWLNDGKWKINVNFEDTALVSVIKAENKELSVSLEFSDFVDSSFNAFIRTIKITNNSADSHDIRIFFHQNFQISSQGRADTVMYVPDGHYMLDYKGRCCILAHAESDDGKPFDQYASGNAGIEGKEGTFKDAEDGELSMSAVEHGGVDSTIRVSLTVESSESRLVNYWLIASDTQYQLEKIHEHLLKQGVDHRLAATRGHWHDWLSIADKSSVQLDDKYKSALRKSLMVIKAHCDKRGGIIASCDSSIYNYGRDYYSYVWPRDGAYAIWPLIKLGYETEAKQFFNFCTSIITQDGYMMHKYQPDKAIGSTWHPLMHGRQKELAIQEDETAIVVFMISEYLKYTNDKEYVLGELYEKFIKPACEFMCQFIDKETHLPHASYDLWEEKFLSSSYTTALVSVALHRASEIADLNEDSEYSSRWFSLYQSLQKSSDKYFVDGKLIKGFLYKDGEYTYDKTLDISSVFGCWMYGYGTKEMISTTMEQVENILLDKSPSGGSPRYENDNYFKSDPPYLGNPWFVTTLWLAQYYASNNDKNRAEGYIKWSLDHALESGVLSEQIDPQSGEIKSVTPLVWSHAELINTLLLI